MKPQEILLKKQWFDHCSTKHHFGTAKNPNAELWQIHRAWIDLDRCAGPLLNPEGQAMVQNTSIYVHNLYHIRSIYIYIHIYIYIYCYVASYCIHMFQERNSWLEGCVLESCPRVRSNLPQIPQFPKKLASASLPCGSLTHPERGRATSSGLKPMRKPTKNGRVSRKKILMDFTMILHPWTKARF